MVKLKSHYFESFKITIFFLKTNALRFIQAKFGLNWPSDVRGGDFSSENYKPRWMPKNGKNSHNPLDQLRNIYKEESPTLNPFVPSVKFTLFLMFYLL